MATARRATGSDLPKNDSNEFRDAFTYYLGLEWGTRINAGLPSSGLAGEIANILMPRGDAEVPVSFQEAISCNGHCKWHEALDI